MSKIPDFSKPYVEDNFVRVKTYKLCRSCNGAGHYLCQTSYYKQGYEKCYWCDGFGHVLKEEKVMTRVNQPFPLAKD